MTFHIDENLLMTEFIGVKTIHLVIARSTVATVDLLLIIYFSRLAGYFESGIAKLIAKESDTGETEQ